jgi:hypothetical protein
MKPGRLTLAVLSILWLCPAGFGQSRRIMGGSAGGSQYQFFYDSFLYPSMPEVAEMGGGTIGGEGVIHRFMSDRRQHVYFGYDLSIGVLTAPDSYRITFSQLTMSSENARQVFGGDASSWTQLATPDWGGPAVRTIRAGEVLALDLLTNNSTGQKIVDYITVQKPSAEPPSKLGPWPRDFIYETGAPRDFRPEDAQLRIDTEGIDVNDNLVPVRSNISGAAIYFYLPMHGRFVLSLTPQPELGFRKAGEIRGSTINFTVGEDTFSLVSTGRIAPGSGPFTLYVLHEPGWQPRAGSTSGPEVGAADRIDQLVGR